MNRPPFNISSSILATCTEIGLLIGRIEGITGAVPQPALRRGNRIRTIHGTLAIEGNTLTLEQVTDVIEGKRVLGPAKDVLEVKNALAVYADLNTWNGTSSRSLLEAHGMLMRGLSAEAGRWRSGDVGIMRGDVVGHIAPPAHLVPSLMEELFSFLSGDQDLHWLVAAAVFHYELEFIHPFEDGNGRMGRLWQQVLLTSHHPSFEFVSIESLIREHQHDYYRVLGECDLAGESSAFVEFILNLLRKAVSELFDDLRPEPSTNESRIERAVVWFGDREFTRKEYMHLHRTLSSATASRDLRWGVEHGLLTRIGEKSMARYTRR